MSSGWFGQSDSMEPRQLGREMNNVAKSSEPLLGMMNEQSRQEGANQLGVSREFADLALSYYPDLAGAERGATSAQRRGDLKDLQKLGGKYRATLGEIAPEWDRSITALDQEVARAGETSPLLGSLTDEAMGRGPSAIRTELERQAQEELALGGELSPEEIRDAVQAARGAYSARGLAYSSPAMSEEVLMRDRHRRERLGERRAFASGVQALALGEDAANRQFASGVEALGASERDAGRRFLTGAVGTQQQALSPVLGWFGRTSVAPTAGAGVLASAPNIVGAGGSSMGPLLAYGSDLYNTNFNAEASTRLNNAANMAAIHGAVIGAVGSMSGAAMCWVAREVFGEETVEVGSYPCRKWHLFRDWVTSRAPWWFRLLYMRYGERVAGWLKTHPWVKARLRPWMEARVRDEVERAELLIPLQNGSVSLCLQPKH